ncbi:MAG: hypothetical protein ACI91R_002076, partial [Vicingaceae bacterium]
NKNLIGITPKCQYSKDEVRKFYDYWSETYFLFSNMEYLNS